MVVTQQLLRRTQGPSAVAVLLQKQAQRMKDEGFFWGFMEKKRTYSMMSQVADGLPPVSNRRDGLSCQANFLGLAGAKKRGSSSVIGNFDGRPGAQAKIGRRNKQQRRCGNFGYEKR